MIALNRKDHWIHHCHENNKKRELSNTIAFFPIRIDIPAYNAGKMQPISLLLMNQPLLR